MMTIIRQRLNQKGFSLVELMVVIAILGVLAAIALPKFTDSTTSANTAKAQADLRTIDSAIVMYQAQKGTDPTEGIGAAGDAATKATLMGAGLLVEPPTPPSGKCFLGGATAVAVPASAYTLETVNGTMRAVCKTGNTSDKFKKS